MPFRSALILSAGFLCLACAGQGGGDGTPADTTVQDAAVPDTAMQDPGMAAGGTMPSLFDITWNLTELNGQTPPAGAGGRPATLLLEQAEGRASGFAGCNRMTGSFTHSGDSLSFGPMATTRMACAEGMELEQQYGAALAEVRTLRLSADGLELMGDSGTVARFSAAPPEE